MNKSLEQKPDPADIMKTDAAKRCQHELRYTLLGIRAFRLGTDAPQSMATEWMALVDNSCVADLSITRLEQRYGLLTIYFGMNLDPVSSNLIAPGTHECDWVNIGCDSDKNVTELNLFRASGTLVEEIGLMRSLSKFDCFDTPCQVIPILQAFAHLNLPFLTASLSAFESSIDGTLPAALLSLSNLGMFTLFYAPCFLWNGSLLC
jgi:hypothetical protein